MQQVIFMRTHMPDEEQGRSGGLDGGQIGRNVVHRLLHLQQVQADQGAHRRLWYHLTRAHSSFSTGEKQYRTRCKNHPRPFRQCSCMQGCIGSL